MDKIAVLLTVYNGKEWIDEQIESILNQTNVYIDIFISIDLCFDGSYEHIKEYYSHHPNIFILPYGEKFGSAGKNFFRTIIETDISIYDYVAFADQDDVWLNDKLSHAITELKNNDVDAYSSNVTAFWENGRTILINKAQPQVKYDYFFEAAGPGCTYVFKLSLALAFQQFLISNPLARNVELHDWLLYAFSRSNGFNWYIDKASKMLYRQHSNNQVGANSSFKAAFKRHALVRSGWYQNEIFKIATVLDAKNEGIIKILATKGCFSRIRTLLNLSRMRRRIRDRFAMFVFICMKYI
jgi:rhamnosyltransferase